MTLSYLAATRMDIFAIVTGSFTVLITVPMILLAMWSRREAEELRHIQTDLVTLTEESRRLAEEMHLLQAEIRKEQHDAVAAADAVGQVGVAVEDVGRLVEVLVADGPEAALLTR